MVKGSCFQELICNLNSNEIYAGRIFRLCILKKPGIKAEIKVLLINQPDNYYSLPVTNIQDQLCKKKKPDFVHLFVKTNKELETKMKKLKAVCKKDPAIIIWISWHKKSAKIPTDVTEDVIRNYAMKNNLVDVKVCAVSEVCSGLKLVVSLSKR